MVTKLAGWLYGAGEDRRGGLSRAWQRRGAMGVVVLLVLATVVAGIEGDWAGARLSLVILVSFGFLFRRFAIL